ncbi:RteC domain-containing protein [Tenacibaculum sp. SSH1-16]|uniref:RteC domain-containing protein n=1 Tax=Tenacibaculum sp. SSH1-16 TaxID=3136667 RepID=UPI0032C43D52
MKKYNNIVNNLNSALDFLEAETEDILIKAEEGIKITKRALMHVRKDVIKRSFKTQEDEIYFFKNIKPQIYSKLIYYVKLFNIENKRPRSSNKSQIKYFNNQIDRLQNYFNDHLEFYRYYRRNATTFDEQYFLRGKENIRLHPDTFHFFTDEQFSTSHDSTVATILAYDMLIVYLKKQTDKLENSNLSEINDPMNCKNSKLFWTANKTDLIELIYALDSIGAINSGAADIKRMATACEQIFNIELGDYYRTYLEIRSRKINQTKFIDKLKESLTERMRNADE